MSAPFFIRTTGPIHDADGKEPGSVRSAYPRESALIDLRQAIGRLEGLPLRPASARFFLSEIPEDSDDLRRELSKTVRWRAMTELEPAWGLAIARQGVAPDPLILLADRPWWPTTSREGVDALSRLWRHSLAVSLAAHRLAREANDPDPDRVARAGFLHGLGRWAVAAIDPEWLARWDSTEAPEARRALELRDLGAELSSLGRTLAERWECDPLVADATWLYDTRDHGLLSSSAEPGRLATIQDAFRLAESTPWSLYGGSGRSPLAHDPRVKLLTAEVQSRCGLSFVDLDHNPREEALTRSNARLRLRLERIETAHASQGRFLTVLESSRQTDHQEAWAEHASLAWCGEPGVTAARVVWQASESSSGDEATKDGRAPTEQHPLVDRGQTVATIHLWREAGASASSGAEFPTLAAWGRWASWIADRQRLQERFDQVALAYRRLLANEEEQLRAAKLDAVAEFAAGAGHELNNPLAVVVGRAQLLLARSTDADSTRSLRAILTQAQRAHRILRDLMYVARPPESRPRFCQPDDIVRASLRDAGDDAQGRDVHLLADTLEHGRRVWADPDGLRHLADTLIRNALEATPKGGQVRFATRGDGSNLRWTVADTGRGITPTEGSHLFDPFFCGRQAGRGLGMGLPRAARFLEQLGGEIRFQSAPGQGSSFLVRLPLAEPPKPPSIESESPAAVVPGGGHRLAGA